MKKIQELSDLNVLHQASIRLHYLSSKDISTQYTKFFRPLEDILTAMSPTLRIITHSHYNPIMVCIYDSAREGTIIEKIAIQDFQIKKVCADVELKIVEAVEDFLTSIK